MFKIYLHVCTNPNWIILPTKKNIKILKYNKMRGISTQFLTALAYYYNT